MWKIVRDGGVWCVEFEGYFLSFDQLRDRAEFWPGHIGKKSWGTPEVVDDLVSIIRRVTDE